MNVNICAVEGEGPTARQSGAIPKPLILGKAGIYGETCGVQPGRARHYQRDWIPTCVGMSVERERPRKKGRTPIASGLLKISIRLAD